MGMETMLNWGKLYREGRCKDIGIPWLPAEHQAVLAGIPADYVRKGILTEEAYQTALKKEAKSEAEPLRKLDETNLVAKANELGIPAVKGASREAVIRAIEDKVAADKVEKSKSKPKK